MATRFLLVAMTLVKMTSCKPNIIMFVADDVGVGDYETTDPAMATPALTKLAQRGVTMNQSYTLQACTPTRTALLTGKYPYRLGFQAGKIKGTYLRYVPLGHTLLPETLKKLNYTTHAVGKWHMGFCDWKLTPRYRGFDTFYGFYSGAQDYFNHSSAGGSFDFRDNGKVAWETKGHYSTELHTKRVQRIINQAAKSKENFFIYMAYQNAHSPYEPKQRYVDKYCSHVRDENRRIHCAMVAALDESIANITKSLKRKGLEDDTIIIYFSDNGGSIIPGTGAFNYPHRGGKGTYFEGGIRSHTIFAHPKGMTVAPGGTWDQLFHVTDWYPTLVRAAGGNVSELVGLDGIDQYDKLLEGLPGARERVILNIDDNTDRTAARIGDFKLLTGKLDRESGWPAPPDMIAAGTAQSIDADANDLPDKQLYNVRHDPREMNNLYGKPEYSDIQRELEEFLAQEEPNLVPFPQFLEKAKTGNPDLYSGAWSPGWCCA